MKLASQTIMGLNVSYRSGSADTTVLDLVLLHNRYRFPNDMNGMTVVDIGAHIGSATMWCASRGATVYAYEPAHENYLICKRNISQNKLSAQAYEQAVGVPGKRIFYLNPSNTASNGERALQGSEQDDLFVAVEAEWVSLQTVFDSNNIDRCDYLKMDCEGGEIDVIPQILMLHDRINVVVGEIHAGQWPTPTPGLDKQISDAVASLDSFYKRTSITHYEHKWEHR